MPRPKAETIWACAGWPGSTTSRASRSASMMRQPSAPNMAATVLLPVATPPVRPTSRKPRPVALTPAPARPSPAAGSDAEECEHRRRRGDGLEPTPEVRVLQDLHVGPHHAFIIMIVAPGWTAVVLSQGFLDGRPAGQDVTQVRHREVGADDRIGQVPELPPATGDRRLPELADDRLEDRRRARQDLVETDLPGRADSVGPELRFDLGLSQAEAMVNVGLSGFDDEGLRV